MEYKILSESLTYYMIENELGEYLSNNSFKKIWTSNLIDVKIFRSIALAKEQIKQLEAQLGSKCKLSKVKMIKIQ